MPFILGTAGHIDHGKTTLVRALTGIDCDRLGEEKKRGITIELGFAWLDLPGGERLGIVDVPGHERFVKNMVAGAAGIDFVMLVVAADEGVMPQTREHLEICSLLGLRDGFVALTKTDMVEPDWLAMVKEELGSFMEGTFLEGAPILEVSAATGQGVQELKDFIVQKALKLEPPRRPDVFRLPVDRVFTLKGHGTVVTGSVISGRVKRDSDACLYPKGLPVRIRSLQRHGRDADEAEPGERLACNLQNVEVADIERGATLADPGSLFPSRKWVVRLEALADAPHPLKHHNEVHFHHGTLEVPARLHFFGRDQLAPGETDLAEVRFEEDMVGIFGDRCVIRSGSPLRACAGGMLLSPLPPELRQQDPAFRQKLDLLAGLYGKAAAGTAQSDQEALAAVLALQGRAGADGALLRVLTGLSKKRLERAVQGVAQSRLAVAWDRASQGWIGRDGFGELCQACLARAAELHRLDPLKAGFARAALEAGWSQGLAPKLVQKVFDTLLGEEKLVSGGDVLCLAGHEVVLGKSQEKLKGALLKACREGHLAPPNLKDILASAGASEKEGARVLGVLLREGTLVKVSDSLYYSKEAMDEITARVVQWFASHDDLTVPGMKEVTGLSRKYLIPLLEHLDQTRVTVRIGDKRQLRATAGKDLESAGKTT
ncbi:MAG: selenocysteine-specific translation elongation factor [Desulfovibrio sp.]|jgi:selenocysteine-specific elongation factor|nr:selenocysteine-specific translation elongation factor [Desulfovibrio sp.]